MWSVARRESAKALFGRPLRIALMVWIRGLEGRPFFQSEAQGAMRETLGVSPSNVPDELSRLVDQGLLSRSEIPPRVYFTAAPSPFWAAFTAIGHALDQIDKAGATEEEQSPPQR